MRRRRKLAVTVLRPRRKQSPNNVSRDRVLVTSLSESGQRGEHLLVDYRGGASVEGEGRREVGD